ncbi:MAG TPA: hypothetical protein VGF86_00215 [Candidatus Tumulicola sp.]|jgi:hypothetical protein
MGSVRRRVFFALMPAILTFAAHPAAVRAETAAYAQMAPVGQYLSPDRQTEVDLARSAAPLAISLHATVMVLDQHGYQTVSKGTNGFTCLVERSWMSPFDSAEFWNWKMRGPICYNPPASRTVLLYTLRRTELALAGSTKAQMLDRIKGELAAKQLPAPEAGSMSYMMSKLGNLGDGVGAWRSHLMFYAPQADGAKDGASWGADLPASPIILDTSHHVVPEPETIFMVAVDHWSDGASAPH